MIPLKPYLLRAYFDWIIDNDLTPLVVVDSTQAGVEVPQAFVKDGRIVLNLSLRAVRNLEMESDAVSFSARFGGAAHNVFFPVRAVLAIYAEENGQVLTFPPEPELPAAEAAPKPEKKPEPKRPEVAKPSPAGPPKGRPALRVVKKDE